MPIKRIEGEDWKPIRGYEEIYEISNYGRVKSLERYSSQKHLLPEKLLKGYDNGNGYWYYDLYNSDRSRKKFSGHRLVGEHFIENPKCLPCINHIDENRSNNNYKNLEWCTYQYNINYGNRSKKAIFGDKR